VLSRALKIGSVHAQYHFFDTPLQQRADFSRLSGFFYLYTLGTFGYAAFTAVVHV